MGLVTAVNAGNATILATTTDGTNLTAECRITSVSGIDEVGDDDFAVEVAII